MLLSKCILLTFKNLYLYFLYHDDAFHHEYFKKPSEGKLNLKPNFRKNNFFCVIKPRKALKKLDCFVEIQLKLCKYWFCTVRLYFLPQD